MCDNMIGVDYLITSFHRFIRCTVNSNVLTSQTLNYLPLSTHILFEFFVAKLLIIAIKMQNFVIDTLQNAKDKDNYDKIP